MSIMEFVKEVFRMRAVCFSLIALVGASLLTGTLAAGADTSTSVTFERDVEPILTRAGCNAGACHGKASGQNGFQLSLLGFDPDFDHAAIAREAGGRRVFPADRPSRACCSEGDGQGAPRRRPAARPGGPVLRDAPPLDRRRDFPGPRPTRRSWSGSPSSRPSARSAATNRSRCASRPTSPTARPRT